MRFGILGPLEVWRGGTEVSVGGPQQRAVLAVLLVGAGRVVSTDRLIDQLWGERPPPTARALVQGCVAGLRRALRDGDRQPLVTRAPGYLINLRPGELDADRFDALVSAAGRAGSPEEKAALLYEALGLWRGPVLGDVPAEGLRPEVARLEERHLTAVEDRIDVDLRLGRELGIVGELQGRVREHPLRERLWGQLMVALHRAGRQADALAAYRELRGILVDQLGLEPGPDLRRLHQAILAGDLAGDPGAGPTAGDAAGTGAAAPVPAQLPAAVAAFTGRAGHLRRLDELAGERDGMPIAVVTGTAGVGKTALAVHWAHRMRDRFPDGQLHVDLRGFAPTPPVPPVEALARFLEALGVPADQVPAEPEPAAALYRSMLAGRRMLVVLDNAAGADQIRPLLPGTPDCLVLVTSRDRLAGLVARDGARRLTLDVLSPGEAHRLLARVLGADRAAAEEQAVRDLARLCAHLPLALRIAAADVTGPVAGHVAELAAADRLGAFEVDGDPASAVRVAFDHSYAGLPADAGRLFRLLGLAPCADVTAPAAAALAGVPDDRARALLNRLAAGHLIEQPVAGRYTFHDLLRTYAEERAHAADPAAERDAALGRLVDWYAGRVEAAARVLTPEMLRLPAPAATGSFAGPAEASAWLDAERRNLVPVVRHAARSAPAGAAWRIADGLRGYFWLRTTALDWLAVAGTGLAAATAAGDLRGQAAAHLSLGDAHSRQGRHDEAVGHYRRAVALDRAAGWTDGESTALGNLGAVHWWAGRLADAAEHYTQALELARRSGRLAGQAVNLGNLGELHHDLDRLDVALAHLTQALELHRRLGSRPSEAIALSNLGDVYRELGRLDEAFVHLEPALALLRELGDRSSEAETLRVLAAAHRDAGRHAQARDLAGGAVDLARETGDVRWEADALNTLGTCERLLGRPATAVELHERALALATATGHRHPEIGALTGLAAAHPDPDRAYAAGLQAVDLARGAGYVLLARHAAAAAGDARDRRGAAGVTPPATAHPVAR